jgi:hypothetical protein
MFLKLIKKNFLFLKVFLYTYGALVLLASFLVLIFKNEKNLKKNTDTEIKVYSVLETYGFIWKLLKMNSILKFIFILVTIRVSILFDLIIFSANNNK